MGIVLTIAVFVLTFVNWSIYHKIFTVYYLGGVGKGFLKEFVGAFIVAMLEIALLQMLGSFVIQIVIVIAFGIGAIFALRGFYYFIMETKQLFGKKQGNNTENKKDYSADKNNEDAYSQMELQKADPDIITDEIRLSYAKSIINMVEHYAAKNPGSDERELLLSFLQKFLSARGEKMNRKYAGIQSRVTCRQCGKEILRGVRFCNFCGKPTEEKKICSSCGRVIASTAKFCNYCGEMTKEE